MFHRLSVAKGEFIDDSIKLKGENSIIGRSLIVHGNGTAGNGARILQGVIGRTKEHETNLQAAQPRVYQAGCRFTPTLKAPDSYLDGKPNFSCSELGV